MSFESQNFQKEVDNSSDEAQEALAMEYLAAHQEWAELMEEWDKIYQAMIRNEAESGHMANADLLNKSYREKMAELTVKMNEFQAKMDTIRPQLTMATADKYLQ